MPLDSTPAKLGGGAGASPGAPCQARRATRHTQHEKDNRRLEVHDFVHAGVDMRDVGLTAGLDEDRTPRIAELAEENGNARLEQGLAAGKLDQ